MVMSKLHIICGNCGSKDDLQFHIDLEGRDFGAHQEAAVHIICNNCGTLHPLDDTIEQKGEK